MQTFVLHHDAKLGPRWRIIPDLPQYAISEKGICITVDTGHVHRATLTRTHSLAYCLAKTTRSIPKLMLWIWPDVSWQQNEEFTALLNMACASYGTLNKEPCVQGNVYQRVPVRPRRTGFLRHARLSG